MDDFVIISDKNYLEGEGPIWNYVTNELWWTDILSKKIYKYAPGTKSITEFKIGINVSSFSFNKKGGMVLASQLGIYFWEKGSGLKLIANEYDDDLLQTNDTIADPKGRFLFGTYFYNNTDNYKLGKLYKLEKDCSISILEEGIHLSNGLGFSPDNSILYYTDSALRTIYKYDYNILNGSLSNRKIFVKISDDKGIPDGLTVDSDGYVWSAQWYGSRIVRYDPDGNTVLVLDTPAKQTSSLAFGGNNLTDIYITSASKSNRLNVAPKWYDFNAKENIGGPIYLCNLGIKGKKEFFADIEIKV